MLHSPRSFAYEPDSLAAELSHYNVLPTYKIGKHLVFCPEISIELEILMSFSSQCCLVMLYAVMLYAVALYVGLLFHNRCFLHVCICLYCYSEFVFDPLVDQTATKKTTISQ